MGWSPAIKRDQSRLLVKADPLTLWHSYVCVLQLYRQPCRMCSVRPLHILVTLSHASISILWTSLWLPSYYRAVPSMPSQFHRLPSLVVLDTILIGWAIGQLSFTAYVLCPGEIKL